MNNRLLRYFLYLGSTGFGGPLALIHQMRIEFVEKRKVIEASDFDQAFTLIKAMPGPIALQMAVFCGKKIQGMSGAFKAAFGLIAPAFCLMLLMAVFYEQMSQFVLIKSFFSGMQFAVAAVILISLRPLLKPYQKSIHFWMMMVLAAILFFNKWVPESLLIVGFGALWALYDRGLTSRHTLSIAPFILLADTDRLLPIFKSCFMAGALVFGTGLAVFPFFQSDFVEKFHWLSLSVFNDAVTFGQMTPGPVTISTTFMGYKMAGLSGAFVATIGLFLPPFLHISTWFIPALNWFKKQKWVKPFLFGSTSAVIGCIAVTVYKMNVTEVSHPTFWIIFILSFLSLWRFRKLSILLVLFAAGALQVVFSLAT